VAQTYDGAAVVADEHAGLQDKLREHCKNATFFRCYSHRLNLVLSQSVRFIKPVKIFFTSLSGFGTFFSKSTKRTEALDSEVMNRFPSVFPTRWNYQSRLVGKVQYHKTDIENLFISIIENGNEWASETVSSARGFLTLLRDFEFNFFVGMFSSIFPHSDSLFQILQFKTCDRVYCNKNNEDIKTHLGQVRLNFESFCKEIVTTLPSIYSVKLNRMEPLEGEDKKSSYRRLFLEILDVMVTNISDRFSDILKLKFFNLIDQKKFTRFKTEFPDDAMSCLAQNYGARFDFSRLRSELTAVYSDPEFSRSVCELHEYIRTQELHDVFLETYSISKLILTIPATGSSTGRSFSALERVKYYLRNNQGQE
jgi:hypothetical protein